MLILTRTLLLLLALLGFTASANASFIQRLDFFMGSDPIGDPWLSARIVFPQQGGCISGTAFFVPPFDCTTDSNVFNEDTNIPDDIVITTSLLGDGTFNVGQWVINNSGFLFSAFSFTAGGFEIGVPIPFSGDSLYPNVTDPIGTFSTGARYRYIETGEEGNLAVLATAVPSPPTLLLMGLGLLGLRVFRAHKVLDWQ